jgi:glycosyltransferase involved in cell wall biosynthesis
MKFTKAEFTPNHYCFLIGSNTIGGQATLIERKSKFLLAKGFKVTIIAHRGATEGIYRSCGAAVHFLSDLDLGLEQLIDEGHHNLGRKLAAELFSAKSDKVFFESYTPLDLYFASTLASTLPYAKIGHYLINSRDIARIPTRALNSMISFGIVYAMNEQCAIDPRISTAQTKPSIPIIPLPIEAKIEENFEDRLASSTILTICRAEYMKEYVVGLINILESMRADFPNLKLRIVGDGDLLDSWKETALRSPASSNVTFLGTLLKEDLDAELKATTVYVGMGTTLLLAVNCGVPSIAVIPWCPIAKSHGFFSELPFGNLGEAIAGKDAIDIEPMLRQVLSNKEYRENETKSATQRLVREFSIEASMKRFLDFATNATWKLTDCQPFYYPKHRLLIARTLFKLGLLKKRWILEYRRRRNQLRK